MLFWSYCLGNRAQFSRRPWQTLCFRTLWSGGWHGNLQVVLKELGQEELLQFALVVDGAFRETHEHSKENPLRVPMNKRTKMASFDTTPSVWALKWQMCWFRDHLPRRPIRPKLQIWRDNRPDLIQEGIIGSFLSLGGCFGWRWLLCTSPTCSANDFRHWTSLLTQTEYPNQSFRRDTWTSSSFVLWS